MKKSLKSVERRVAVQLVVSRDYSLPLCLRLRYEPTDPHAVRAVFFADCDEPVTWVLGRDLPADGLKGPAGCADVHLTTTHPDLAARLDALPNSAAAPDAPSG